MAIEKEELLGQFGDWIRFVQELGQMDEYIWNQSIADGKWSVREVVAHIQRWDDYFFEEAIAKAAASEPLTVRHLDYDLFNEKAKHRGKSATIGQLTEEAVASRSRIIRTIENASESVYARVYEDGDGHPFAFGQYLKDFLWHDRHHMDQIKRLIHFRLEEMSLNGWPALQTVLFEGWLLRFADGYTKRSNSIQAIYGNTMDTDAKIEHCEKLYGDRGLPAVFKVTPFVKTGELDRQLAERNYELIDHTLVKTVSLSRVAKPDDRYSEISLEPEPSDLWLDALGMFSRLSEEHKSITRKMMEQSPLRKCFALLYDNGIPVACGLAVVEREWVGLYDIATGSAHRNKGHGERLIRHLLAWGEEQGATSAYLLVVKANAPANRLYDKIGFAFAYDYWYRVKK